MIETSSVGTAGLNDLESRLYRQLEIPLDSPSLKVPTLSKSDPTGLALSEVRRELFALHREAARIGKVPEYYPRHVVIVMKAISALLPWYTRPLVHFGHSVVQTTESMTRLLDEIVRNQDTLARELAHLRNTSERGTTSERESSEHNAREYPDLAN